MKRLAHLMAAALTVTVGATACEGEDAVYHAIHQYFGDALNDKAVRVARCESGLNPNAVSPGGGNHGLFQINNVHRPMVEGMGYKWSDIYNPYVNSKIAKIIYDDAVRRGQWGWQPWGCRNA